MAKKEEVQSPSELLSTFLKSNKDDHYNFEDPIDYKVSSGSLILDMQLGGGLPPGLHRFTGTNEGGKTSSAFEVTRNFLKAPKRRAVYIKAEGRLSKEMQERSGVNFVFSPDEWEDGTCFVFESNIYETCVNLLRSLVAERSGTQYCFILDSVDGLISKNDIDKSLEESAKVAGGAVIAANLMKRISIALAKRGHIAIFISQVRADIKLDPYSKEPIRQTTATGGNALLHFSNWILEFQPRFTKDLILKHPENKKISPENPAIGHWAKVVVKKSINEKTNMVIPYPIRYGQKGGKSIWCEKEIIDLLLLWGFLQKRGAWFNFTEDFCEMVQDANLTLEEVKFQGEKSVFNYLEKNQELTSYLYNYFLDMFSESETTLQEIQENA